ncbi:MAG TPA: IS110 family transposase [Wenzhouxiangella sp.]|nr:IS110 family transposase [Wenzhouxiangella sp.]
MAQQVSPISYGADVDSRFIQINAYGHRAVCKIENSPRAIRAWLKSITVPARLAVEATGAYHLELADQAYKAGLTVYILNPRAIRQYRESVGQRAKNDRCDALLIARYIDREHDELRPYTPLDARQRRVWQLLKRRATLVKSSQQVQQSLAGITALGQARKQALSELDRLIALIEKQIETLLKELGLWELVNCCQSVRGIGRVTGMGLVIAFDRGDFESADAFVAYLGMDVRVRDSGKFVGQRKLTKKGDGEYRRLIYNAAVTAGRYDFKPYLERFKDRGMKSTQAYVALARKLIRIAFALMKNREQFDPNRLRIA